jgi:hypothetical protein
MHQNTNKKGDIRLQTLNYTKSKFCIIWGIENALNCELLYLFAPIKWILSLG